VATMITTAFLAAAKPVAWTRQIFMIKRRFVIVLDRLESAGVHEYRWMYHYAPTTVKTDAPRKRLLTGFDNRNLLLMPFKPELFAQMEVNQHYINNRGRNILAPVVDFVANASDMMAAFLLLPVSGVVFPDIELAQTDDAGGVTLEVHSENESTRLFIRPVAAAGGANREATNVPTVAITQIQQVAAKLG
jgi:hypothetical protein